MLEKRAEFKLINLQPLNAPDDQLSVDSTIVQETMAKIASHQAEIEDKRGVPEENTYFDLEAEIKDHPDSLFVKCFAIKADEMNDNGDFFGREQLKEATETFVGVPCFTNHSNQDINEARGKVIHSWWDDEKNGIMVIARIDAEAYPQLARGIKEEYVVSTSMGCFTAECRVLLSNGTYIPISEVQPGDYVYTHLGNIKEVANTQIRTKKEPLRHIKFEGYGSIIEITQNHKILSLKKHDLCACGCGQSLPKYKRTSHRAKNWKIKYRKRFINGHSQKVWNSNPYAKTHRSDLKELMQSSRSFSTNDTEWINAGDLSVGDVVLLPVHETSVKHKDCTTEKARLLGYFLSEGCYTKRKGDLYSVCFSFGLHEKDTYARETADLLKAVWPNCNPCINPKEKNNVCMVIVRNPAIAKWFYYYCGEYSHKKKLHSDVLLWPDKYLKHLLGTFINGDGCFSTRRPDPRTGSIMQTISMDTSSPDLASQLHFIATKVGIYTECRVTQAHKSYELKKAIGFGPIEIPNLYFSNQADTMRVRPSYHVTIPNTFIFEILNYATCSGPIYKKRNFSDMRFVYTNYNEISSEDKNTIPKNKTKNKLKYLVRPIKSIQDIYYEGPVYNLEVKDDHSYIVEDIAVKNCQVKHSICSICHNLATVPGEYCEHIRERKTRVISAKNQKCSYHKHGVDEQCPLCGSKKGETKTFSLNEQTVFEYNYGIKFIENSFVVSPACHDCGVTEIIDPQNFLAKVAEIEEKLPGLIKMAQEIPIICTDQTCFNLLDEKQAATLNHSIDVLKQGAKYVEKIAGQEQIGKLNQALDLLTEVSQDMLQQKEQIDLEFLSDLVKVLADLQGVTDELTEQGYGRLPSPGQEPGQEGVTQPGTQPLEQQNVTRTPPATGGASRVQSGPAGEAGTVTTPLAIKRINLEKTAEDLMIKSGIKRINLKKIAENLVIKSQNIETFLKLDEKNQKNFDIKFEIKRV